MSDIHSYNSTELINEVDAFSKFQLKKKSDLQLIFEECLAQNNLNLLQEISFTAKYVNGLMRVLNSGAKINEVNSLEHVKKDLSLNMNKIIKQLKTLFSDADNSKKNHFENNYLQMEQISFQNLNELLSDLEWTKKYLNDLKRGEKK